MTRTHCAIALLALLFTGLDPKAPAASDERLAARVVVWTPRRGQLRDFQEGYKRHLEWHRAHGDRWSWYGWMVSTGARSGTFIDGSFFHAWSDLDASVAPAEDAADNALNVEPYAEALEPMVFEAVPKVSNLGRDELTAPLLSFVTLETRPGGGPVLESALERASWGAVHHLVLRPVSGSSAYLVLLVASKQAELPQHSAALQSALQSAPVGLVTSVRIETARFHSELSHLPR